MTTTQLRAVGLHDDVVSRWVDEGRLHPVFRTVFAFGRRAVGPRARLRAVVLACGPGTVISHRSAAWLLGLRENNPVVVDVMCPGQAGRKVDGIRVHIVRYPAPSEVRAAYGIPCTTVARTLVDLAGSNGIEKLREAFEMAATRRVLDIAAVDAVLANGPRRRGAPALRLVLDEWRPVAETAKYSTIRSLFEAKLLPLVAAANLPIPKVNARVRTAERILEVDLLWPDQLTAANYEVLRVTWREAENEPDEVFAVLRARMNARPIFAT